jgi:hypothetical protein
MGDKIIFPHNYEGYLKKGLLAFEQGDLSIAEERIGKALHIKKTAEIVPLYIMLLQETNQPIKAVRFIEDYQSGIAEANSLGNLDFLYIKCLIQAENYEQAREQLESRKNQGDLTTDLAFTLQQLEAEVEKVELEILEKKLKQSTDILKAEKGIAEQSFQKQQQYTTQLKVLDDDYFLKIAERLLLNRGVHRLLKTEVLHQCLERKLNTVIKANVSGKEVRIDLSQLLPLKETELFKHGSAYIDEQIADQDPTLAQVIRNEFFMQLSLLYPFEEQEIGAVEDWMAILYLKYTGGDYVGFENAESIILKIEKIEKEIAELATFFD